MFGLSCPVTVQFVAVMTTTELGMSLPTSFGWHDSLVTSSWSTYSPIDTREKANRWTPTHVWTVLSGKGSVCGRDDDYWLRVARFVGRVRVVHLFPHWSGDTFISNQFGTIFVQRGWTMIN